MRKGGGGLMEAKLEREGEGEGETKEEVKEEETGKKRKVGERVGKEERPVRMGRWGTGKGRDL